MRIVVAPNAFKGSLSALDAAEAIAEGVRAAASDADLVLVPIADGGDGTVDALVSWGRASPARKPRATIKLGSYSAVERLIRIHPNLDRSWVPRYFVQFIIYHEMLHHVIPASQGGGRRMLHPPIFTHRERLFRDYERALAWEKAHIGRLLRS